MNIVVYTDELKDQVVAFFEKTWIGMGRTWQPQGMDSDIFQIPKIYQINGGNFWVVLENNAVIGTAALKPLSDQVAELKRFYIKPGCRGTLGLRLYRMALAHAVKSGFKVLRLDTNNEKMPAVLKRAGFVEVEPYYYNPKAKTFMELKL